MAKTSLEGSSDARESRRLSTLLEVSQALSGTLNQRSALHKVLEILTKHHGYIRSLVTLLHDNGELHIEASDGLDGPAHNVKYRVGEGIIGRVVESARPIVVPRVSKEPAFLNRASKRSEAAKDELSFVCVPILLNRRAVGALGVDLKYRADRDYDRTVKFLNIVASNIAQAVKIQRLIEDDKKRLVQENTQLRQELKERYDFSSIIGTSGPVRQMYEQMAQVAAGMSLALIRGNTARYPLWDATQSASYIHTQRRGGRTSPAPLSGRRSHPSHGPVVVRHDTAGGRRTGELGGERPADLVLINRPDGTGNQTAEPGQIGWRVRVTGNDAGTEQGEVREADRLDGLLLHAHHSRVTDTAAGTAPRCRQQREVTHAGRVTSPGEAADDADFERLQVFFAPLHAALPHADTRGAVDWIARSRAQLFQAHVNPADSVFEFGDTVVREIMSPRPDIAALPAGASLRDVQALVLERAQPLHGFGRCEGLVVVHHDGHLGANRRADCAVDCRHAAMCWIAFGTGTFWAGMSLAVRISCRA